MTWVQFQLQTDTQCLVVTFSPPTSEVRLWLMAWPQVGQLVVACRWLAVYSRET